MIGFRLWAERGWAAAVPSVRMSCWRLRRVLPGSRPSSSWSVRRARWYTSKASARRPHSRRAVISFSQRPSRSGLGVAQRAELGEGACVVAEPVAGVDPHLRGGEHGVRRLVGDVLAKLNCPNRTLAVLRAIEYGLLIDRDGEPSTGWYGPALLREMPGAFVEIFHHVEAHRAVPPDARSVRFGSLHQPAAPPDRPAGRPTAGRGRRRRTRHTGRRSARPLRGRGLHRDRHPLAARPRR